MSAPVPNAVNISQPDPHPLKAKGAMRRLTPRCNRRPGNGIRCSPFQAASKTLPTLRRRHSSDQVSAWPIVQSPGLAARIGIGYLEPRRPVCEGHRSQAERLESAAKSIDLCQPKEIAQIGVTTGRGSHMRCLSAVVNKPASELGSTRGYVRDAASRSFSSFL